MRHRRPLSLVMLVLCVCAGLVPLRAQAATPPVAATESNAVTPAQAQQALAVLQDDARRTQLLDVLRTLAAAAPLAPAAPATPATPPAAAPATGPAKAPAAVPKIVIAPNSLGAEIVGELSYLGQSASDQVSRTTQTVTNFPALIGWLRFNLTDPSARAALFDSTWRLLVVFAGSLVVERLLRLLLRRPSRALAARARARRQPEHELRRRRDHAAAVLRRVPLALGNLSLDLANLLVMGVTAYVLLALFTQPSQARSIIVVVLNAYVECRLVLSALRMLFAPRQPELRLVQASDATARFVQAWARRLVTLLVFAPALIETVRMLGLYQDAVDTLGKLLGLVSTLALLAMVLQSRAGVTAWLRADPENHGWLAVMRRAVATWWHVIAIVLLVGLWVVWTFEIAGGFSRVVGLLVTTAAVAIAARVLTIVLQSAFDRAFRVSPELHARYPGLERRAGRYAPLGRRVLATSVAVVGVIVLLQFWGLDALAWFHAGSVGGRLVSAIIAIGIAAVVAAAVWEAMNAWLDREIARLSREQQHVRAVRLRTLLPILRTSLFIALLVILALTVLSEIGVNTGPLLAGASIFGVALGFGSQRLVQDFITGIFLLLENAMQVGDWVTVANLSGAVENLSIRTIRLRAGDGSVHIVPFSSVTSVTNVNRGIGNAAISVIVAYEEDTDRVGEVLKQIGAELREDPAYSDMIRSDLALWGVDRVEGAGVTIAGQIECTDAGRWGVQREFNRRMKMRLQSLGVALAVPVQTVLLRRDDAPPPSAMRPMESAAASPTTETQSPPPGALGNST